VISAVLFGSVHLGFHGAFPNWRWSIVASILGVFLALARRQTGGIQAGMVAHALVVTVWKTFLL
jgi:membrane protease YdiL (CAAX protease family)